ncbi:MAG TPA: hypothetical protein PLA53_01620 [bacterium]|jgi:hypothetical protein|nr:hypothetical protein [bacterium]HNZ51094.1 hypothetical protein [bacterium]HOF79850.1 hypothetical protein [bacterium]HOH85358.1 hypothetical protein [bacterium]HOQ91651.1 hypothetical protein [bacterium]
MKNKKNLLLALTVILALTISFWLGRLSGRGNANMALANRRQAGPMAVGQRQGFGNQNTQNQIIGQIDKITDNQLAIKLIDGGSRLLMLPSEAVITKTASATSADLVVGQSITASGAEEGGVVLVKTLQINQAEPPRF